MKPEANKCAGVDAGWRILFAFERAWSGTTQREPWANVALSVNDKNTFAGQLITSALLVTSFTTGCASLGTAGRDADFPEQRAQIEQRLEEVIVAAENKDFNRLDSYHLYGPKFTKFTGSSPARLDAAATRKGEHDGLASLKGLKMRADSLKIDVFGNVGIATFILDYSFDSGGQTVGRKDRSTLVFVKESGTWKIAHEHLSPITLAEPGGAANGSQPTVPGTKRTSSAAGFHR